MSRHLTAARHSVKRPQGCSSTGRFRMAVAGRKTLASPLRQNGRSLPISGYEISPNQPPVTGAEARLFSPARNDEIQPVHTAVWSSACRQVAVHTVYKSDITRCRAADWPSWAVSGPRESPEAIRTLEIPLFRTPRRREHFSGPGRLRSPERLPQTAHADAQ